MNGVADSISVDKTIKAEINTESAALKYWKSVHTYVYPLRVWLTAEIIQ